METELDKTVDIEENNSVTDLNNPESELEVLNFISKSFLPTHYRSLAEKIVGMGIPLMAAST